MLFRSKIYLKLKSLWLDDGMDNPFSGLRLAGLQDTGIVVLNAYLIRRMGRVNKQKKDFTASTVKSKRI